MSQQRPCVDDILDRFDRAWAAGEQPDWATFLHLDGSVVDQELAWEIIQRDLYWRLRLGLQEAAPCRSVEVYIRHPDVSLSAQRRQQLAALEDEWRKEFVAPLVNTPSPAGDSGPTEPQAVPVSPPMPFDLDRLERLGFGGMGVVYRSPDASLQRDVALKVLRPELNPSGIKRFLQEADILAKLEHPGIVPIHLRGFLCDGRPFFTMKVVQGRTLDRLLRAREAVSERLPNFLDIFEQVCQTLAYAHAKNIVHHDLKPANVMVGEFCEVQVMDWGLARELRSDTAGSVHTGTEGDASLAAVSPAPVVAGTYPYMAPEQACGDAALIDRRADVFELGAILCEILTGFPPYREPDLKRKAELADLGDAWERLARSGADPELIQIARTCLSASPEDRPRDAAAVAKHIAAYRADVQKRLETAKLEKAQAEVRAQEAQARLAAEQQAAEMAAGRARMRLLAVALGLGLLLLVAAGAWWIEIRHRQARHIVESLFDKMEPALAAGLPDEVEPYLQQVASRLAEIDAADLRDRLAAARRDLDMIRHLNDLSERRWRAVQEAFIERAQLGKQELVITAVQSVPTPDRDATEGNRQQKLSANETK
jgi:hypothetical protein